MDIQPDMFGYNTWTLSLIIMMLHDGNRIAEIQNLRVYNVLLN